MNQLTGKPKLLKQANLSLIRRVIKSKGTATRAEIAEETDISFTTVRSLLNEMMENGEIESIGYDESSGGRKAERYGFQPNRYYSVAFCISDDQIHALLVNICGEILETVQLEYADGNYEEVIFPFLDELCEQREIKAIGLGVPGIVEGGSYWKKRLGDDELYQVDIGHVLFERYNIPVVLENNLNAAAIGFEQCYEKEFPDEKSEHADMAYLHFEKGCIGAGFIAGGRILRGHHNFAGEIGLIPSDDEKMWDDRMAETIDDLQYARNVTEILNWICGILNPEYIALGGPDLRKDCIKSIGSLHSSMLTKRMTAEILYAGDIWHDYHNGMAFLTSSKMFDDIQLRKE